MPAPHMTNPAGEQTGVGGRPNAPVAVLIAHARTWLSLQTGFSLSLILARWALAAAAVAGAVIAGYRLHAKLHATLPTALPAAGSPELMAVLLSPVSDMMLLLMAALAAVFIAPLENYLSLEHRWMVGFGAATAAMLLIMR